MGILRTDLIAHSQLTSTNASVLFDGGDGNAGSTGLKTADSGNKYVIQNDIGELTIECWIYCTSVSQTFDTIWATNNYGVSGNAANFYQHYDGVYWTIAGGTDLDIRGLFEVNKWYHVATTRQWSPTKSTNQWRIYVDGEIVGYNETGSSISEGVLCIGANNYGSAFPAYEFAGYISNFRMCKRALYKEKFTPSKFKLKNIPGTVLLCCQDASDDTAVTVGDTLTAGGSPTPGGFGPDLKEDTTDTGVVFEDNTKFDTLSYMVPPGGTTAESNRGRGVWMGGYTSAPSAAGVNLIYYVQIQSLGNAGDFGDLTKGINWGGAAGASSTRGLHAGGTTPTNLNSIEYITIATTSNSTDFGDLTALRGYTQACSNNTRALIGGGRGGSPTASLDSVDYVTIATTGNAADFGDLTVARQGGSGLASATRGLIMGGRNVPSAPTTFFASIDRFTIATAGNAADYGDLSSGVRAYMGSTSSSTRGIIGGGNIHPARVNNIDYITIASDGNSTDFGDLLDDREHCGAVSNQIRGLFAGGVSPYRNSIEYVTIASTGNAQDFGDVPDPNGSYAYASAATSDSHGGIS